MSIYCRWLGDEIGRLARLKILWEQSRVGSIPTRATKFISKTKKDGPLQSRLSVKNAIGVALFECTYIIGY